MLRTVCFVAYLASWLAVMVAAAWNVFRGRASVAVRITVPVVVGTLLQGAGVWSTTLTVADGPLRPSTLELALALVLAPLGAALFVWALRSAPASHELATGGPYAWLRHPMYLAFLALLLATGLLASAGYRLIVSVALYLAGTELRVATEEAELVERFGDHFSRYREATRSRYLPGVR
jgi:protein-S-isoprenylcysteine O-methyltransferase Ste14